MPRSLCCFAVLSWFAGYLVLRTAAITFTYAIATGLTARAGPSAAACHQVCIFRPAVRCIKPHLPQNPSCLVRPGSPPPSTFSFS